MTVAELRGETRHELRRLTRLLEAAYQAHGGPPGVRHDRDRITGSENSGYALWTEPDRIETAVVTATCRLQSAHDHIGRIREIPAHWSCPPTTSMLAWRDVSHGLGLLAGALDWVPDGLDVAGIRALDGCRADLRGAVRALLHAQGRRLTSAELKALRRRRCRVPGCRVTHHARGLCQWHYNHRADYAAFLA